MWFHKAEAGTFWIRFVPRGRGIFILGIDGRELGSYFSPEAAADDVYRQETGFTRWDSAEDMQVPTDLSEWKRLDCIEWDSGRGPDKA
jgi:hypothetical protein